MGIYKRDLRKSERVLIQLKRRISSIKKNGRVIKKFIKPSQSNSER